jgi:hypothetical protein
MYHLRMRNGALCLLCTHQHLLNLNQFQTYLRSDHDQFITLVYVQTVLLIIYCTCLF